MHNVLCEPGLPTFLMYFLTVLLEATYMRQDFLKAKNSPVVSAFGDVYSSCFRVLSVDVSGKFSVALFLVFESTPRGRPTCGSPFDCVGKRGRVLD